MAFVYTARGWHVTIFSTGGKFRPVSKNFTELHTLTLASRSDVFLVSYILSRGWAVNHLPQCIHKNIFLQVTTAGVPLAISGDVPVIMCNWIWYLLQWKECEWKWLRIISLIWQIPSSPCKRYRCGSVQCNHGNRNEATCLAPWWPVLYLYLWSWHRTVIVRVWKVPPPYTLNLLHHLFLCRYCSRNFNWESDTKGSHSGCLTCKSVCNQDQEFWTVNKIAIVLLFLPDLHTVVPRTNW